MPPELYQELEQRITAELQRNRTLMRDPVCPGVKLAVILRHLVTGDSYTTLQYAFRVASSTIDKFVPEVCPGLPWMESIFQSDVNKGEVACTATTRVSTLLYSWPWRMEITSSCGWMWGQPGQAQIFKHTDLRPKIEDGSIGFPDSESLGIGGPKVNFFILRDDLSPSSFG